MADNNNNLNNNPPSDFSPNLKSEIPNQPGGLPNPAAQDDLVQHPTSTDIPKPESQSTGIDSQPGFGVPIDANQPETPKQPNKLAQAVQQHATSGGKNPGGEMAPGAPGAKPTTGKQAFGNNLKTNLQAGQSVTGAAVDAGKQVALDATKKAATEKAKKVLAETLLKTGGVATGGVSTAIAYGMEAYDKLKKTAIGRYVISNIPTILAVLVLTTTAIGIWAFMTGLAEWATLLPSSPSINGGTSIQQVSATTADGKYYTNLLSGNKGATVKSQLDALDKERNTIETLLKDPKNYPKGANVAQAKQLLTDLHNMRATMLTDSYDQTRLNTDLQTYYGKMDQLYTTLFGSDEPNKAQVLAFIQSGVFTMGGICGDGPKTDIQHNVMKPNSLKILAAIGQFASQNGYKIPLSCFATGHRAYVGKPVNEGNPDCSAATAAGNTPNSPHCLGRGIDIQAHSSDAYTAPLLAWLDSQVTTGALPISQVIYETAVGGNPGNYYNVNGGKITHGFIMSGHDTHIHITAGVQK